MAAPYSMDLRRKVVEVHKKEKISQPKLAERFNISARTVARFLRLNKLGELEHKKGKKGRPGVLDERSYKIIGAIIEKNPTITLAELSEIFYKKKKIKAGRSILSRACQKLELRYKKLSRYASEQKREDIKKNGKRI